MKASHIQTLEKLYANFAKGDFPAVLGACADAMTFQVPGKSRLAGKYTKADFVTGYANKLSEHPGGAPQLEVHDMLASDQHATVLATSKVHHGGKLVELRTVHVWRFDGEKPLAWYEYPRDLYKFDEVWG